MGRKNQKKKNQKIKEQKPKRGPKLQEQTQFEKNLKQYIELIHQKTSIDEAILQKYQSLAEKQELIKLGNEITKELKPLVKKEMIRVVTRQRPEIGPMNQLQATTQRNLMDRKVNFFKEYIDFYDKNMIQIKRQEDQQNRRRIREMEQHQRQQRRLRSRRQ